MPAPLSWQLSPHKCASPADSVHITLLPTIYVQFRNRALSHNCDMSGRAYEKQGSMHKIAYEAILSYLSLASYV